MNKKDKTTLGYLGPDFQLKLVKCFFEDQTYFTSIQHIVDQNMFTNEHLRRIVGFMKDRYNFTETVTTYFEMETIIRSKVSDAISVEQLLAVLDKVKEMDLNGMDLVEEESEKFFKQQNLTKAMNKAQEIIKNGDFANYYVIEDIVRKSLETNMKQDLGFRLFENIESDLSEDYRIAIPTGADKLDAVLRGGLAKGELGVIVAPPGIGKAQPLTSKVLTPNGFINMGDIQVGDKVIGRDGKAYNVSGVYPQGVRPIYKVTFSNGASCECDIEHLWNVKKRRSVGGWQTLTLKNIIDNGHLTKSGKWKYYVPSPNVVEFVSEDILTGSAGNRVEYLSGLNWKNSKGGRLKRLKCKSVEEASRVLELERSLGVNASTNASGDTVIVWNVPQPLYIVNIEYVRDDYAQCIMVDSDEHLYITDNFIVTHNTSATTGFAANAATYKCEENNYKGFKVLHYFFEDEEVSIRRKYYGFVTDIDAIDLHLPDIKPLALERLNADTDVKQMLKENIIGERLQTGEVRASEIKNKIRQHIARGFKPDLIILDYFECLKFEKSEAGDSEWSKEGVTMRKLEAMANEFNVALWVPVQGTRDSIGAEIVGLMQAGGSVKKTQIAHVVITFAQPDEMKTQGRMNLYLGKFRSGRIDRNKFTNIRFNNGTCKFDMSDMDEGDDVPFEGRMSNTSNDIAKKTLYEQKYN